MQSGFKQHSGEINEQARAWFSLMQSGSVREEQKAQFEAWREGADAHRDAYEQLEIIWRDMAVLAHSEEGSVLNRSVDEDVFDSFFVSTGKKFKALMSKLGLADESLNFLPQASLALASVTIVIAVFSLSQSRNTDIQIYSTAMGEMKTINLDDGSEITLGAKSRMRAWASEDERRVVLETGQAFFVVAKDSARPFLVDANNTRVRVVGTQFDVHLGVQRTRVAVLEGIVDVRASSNNADTNPLAPNRLTAGQQITQLDTAAFQAVTKISETELSAWRSGRLIYRNANLVDVIADANRYYDGEFVLAEGVPREMKVTATVRTNEIRFLPDMLMQSLPLVVEKAPSGRVLISPKPP